MQKKAIRLTFTLQKVYGLWYKTTLIAVQNDCNCSTKNVVLQLLLVSKRPFACKQKAVRL